MSGVTWQQCAEVIQRVLNGEKFDKDMAGDEVAYTLIGANLITREERQKPCPTCGTPRHDFSYWRVSAAGRMLVNALATIGQQDGGK